MTDVELEWWWPSPEAFNDLEVADIEDSWQLSAPGETELAEWLTYWSQSEDHHALFQQVFVKTLTDYANFILNDLETNGENEVLPDGSQSDREQAQDVGTGTLSEHEPGSNSESPQA